MGNKSDFDDAMMLLTGDGRAIQLGRINVHDLASQVMEHTETPFNNKKREILVNESGWLLEKSPEELDAEVLVAYVKMFQKKAHDLEDELRIVYQRMAPFAGVL